MAFTSPNGTVKLCKIYGGIGSKVELNEDTFVDRKRDEQVTDLCMKKLNLFKDYRLPRWDKEAGVCYRGELGELQNAINGAALDVELARDELAVLRGDISAQESFCFRLAADADKLKKAKEELDDFKRVFGFVERGAGLVVNAVSLAAGGGLNPAGLFDSMFGGMLDEANIEWENVQLAIAADQKLAECWLTADSMSRRLVGATTRIKRRTIDLEGYLVAKKNLAESTATFFEQGVAALNREAERPSGTFAHHFWFDEKVERFKREMEWARRLVFLAMRAVEYEFQQSLPLRREILAANHPDQLEVAIRHLQTEQAGRTIGRKRPDEKTVVLSARDDIMKVEDRSNLPDGERAWNPATRFRGRLWDARFEMRDHKGNWIGQGVPFTFGPLPEFKNRCGERVWRLNATIQGDGLGTREPGASVLILKRNTFSSQWCADRSDGKTPLQTASITPSSHLFRLGTPGDPGNELRQFSSAMVYPWFNVRRADFFKDAYHDGSSEELAGRGLYGDYIVLFPKELLDKGFALDRVEDILLRFDYLSVDNLPPVVRAERQQSDLPITLNQP
jgi:hypothetical protein